jgi:hypothetical protein
MEHLESDPRQPAIRFLGSALSLFRHRPRHLEETRGFLTLSAREPRARRIWSCSRTRTAPPAPCPMRARSHTYAPPCFEPPRRAPRAFRLPERAHQGVCRTRSCRPCASVEARRARFRGVTGKFLRLRSGRAGDGAGARARLATSGLDRRLAPIRLQPTRLLLGTIRAHQVEHRPDGSGLDLDVQRRPSLLHDDHPGHPRERAEEPRGATDPAIGAPEPGKGVRPARPRFQAAPASPWTGGAPCASDPPFWRAFSGLFSRSPPSRGG